MLAGELQSPLPPPVRTERSPRWGPRQALVSPQRCDGPFEGAETDSPFSGRVGLRLGAGTLSPGVTGERASPRRPGALCTVAETMGAAAGLA